MLWPPPGGPRRKTDHLGDRARRTGHRVAPPAHRTEASGHGTGEPGRAGPRRTRPARVPPSRGPRSDHPRPAPRGAANVGGADPAGAARARASVEVVVRVELLVLCRR